MTAVAVSDGKVYATDAYQVLVFDTQGKLLKQFGRPGTGPDGLDHPNGIAVDRQGRIFVSDSNHNRVTAFSPDGNGAVEHRQPHHVAARRQSTNPFVLPRGIDGPLGRSDPGRRPAGAPARQAHAGGQVRWPTTANAGEEPGQVNFPTGLAASRAISS